MLFNKIKMGKKDIEMRLYDDKRKRIKPKDKIEFTNNETGEMLYVSVVAIHVFDNFEDVPCSCDISLVTAEVSVISFVSSDI